MFLLSLSVTNQLYTTTVQIVLLLTDKVGVENVESRHPAGPSRCPASFLTP